MRKTFSMARYTLCISFKLPVICGFRFGNTSLQHLEIPKLTSLTFWLTGVHKYLNFPFSLSSLISPAALDNFIDRYATKDPSLYIPI